MKEERRLAKLKKKKQQQCLNSGRSTSSSDSFNKKSQQKSFSTQKYRLNTNYLWNSNHLRCYLCNSSIHLVCDFHACKTESQDKKTGTQEKKDNKTQDFLQMLLPSLLRVGEVLEGHDFKIGTEISLLMLETLLLQDCKS